MKKFFTIYLLICSILWVAGCTEAKKETSEEIETGKLKYAHFLRIDEGKGYTVVNFINGKDSSQIASKLILVDRHKELPDSLPKGVILRIPLTNVAIFSTVFSGVMEELGRLDAVKGVVDAEYYTQPKVMSGLKSGQIADLGPSSTPSIEKITAQQPQALLLSNYEGMDVKGLDKLNIPIIYMADNLEVTPLGRAEWIRLFGILFGQKNRADSIFAEVEKKYLLLKEEAANYPTRPRVLVENMYQGVWYLPGGNSYQAQMITDAGGEYIWKDNKSNGSLALAFEDVIQKAYNADIWLLRLFGVDLTKEKLLGMDSRYSYFKTIEKDGVYYANTRTTPLFEEFPYHPERLLQDYILIFHPESKGKTRYFQKMKKS